jgi:hypothetical protein
MSVAGAPTACAAELDGGILGEAHENTAEFL